MRPEGNLGLQIAFTVDGLVYPLWLSTKTPAKNIASESASVFRTPENHRLNLPVGSVIESLLANAKLQEPLPQSITSSRVDQLEFIKYPDNSFAFGLKISIDLAGSSVAVWLQLSKGKTVSFKLVLRLGDENDPVDVDVELTTDGDVSLVLDQQEDPKNFNLNTLANTLSHDLAELLDDVEIAPTTMALATHKRSGNYVLALALSGDLSLSRLPFVGEHLPKGADIGIKNMNLVWCSAGLATDQVARTEIRKTLSDVAILKSPSGALKDDLDPLMSGGMFSAELTIAPNPVVQTIRLALQRPVIKSATLPTNTAATNTTTTPASQARPAVKDSVKWIKVEKNAGPLLLKQIGFKYENKKVWFLFDVSLRAGPVTLVVDGLGAGLNPSSLLKGQFKPSFALRGLGLAIKGPAEVGGSFLRDHIEDPRGSYDEFSGVIVVKTKALTVSGMGSYADPPWGDPSLFAYAFLDKPIGGPAFFFVTGLALGIALNRNLELPPIDQVSTFPLVRLALGESLTPMGESPAAVNRKNSDSDLDRLLEVQRAMRPYTTPASGKFAVAVGVRFTTFNIINSFALLVLSLSKSVRLDMLISSRLQIPPVPQGVEKIPVALAKIGIDLRGTFLPEEGTLIIEGRITEGSWFLDKSCRLSGGAAFAAWSSGKHAGDFVTTVGGYHPSFKPPAHYPKVPRLAFNFISGPVQIKGDAYFAMTPSALMAGGSLSATYADGDVKAWFDCGADFLVAWEPFSYEASMYLEVGASYRTFLGTISVSIGASLALWGPDLAGRAILDLSVMTVEVDFGPDKALPAPLDAKAFRERFLPEKNEDLISFNIVSGLIRKGTYNGQPLFVVNPAEFSLMIDSVIPQPDGNSIGIGPMGRAALSKKPVLTWDVDKEDTSFTSKPLHKPVPSALWAPAKVDGQVLVPDFSTTDTVINAAVGHTLAPKKTAKARISSKAHETEAFAHNEDKWAKTALARTDLVLPEDTPVFQVKQERLENILGNMSDNTPVQLLAALVGGNSAKQRDFASEVSVNTDWLEDLQELPSVGTLKRAT